MAIDHKAFFAESKRLQEEFGMSAGAPEIEVTTAMIEAGADILAHYDPETDRLTEAVRQIFLAMIEARP